MFEKILFPTDFSDVSEKALGSIKALKGHDVKEVIVLHVMDHRWHGSTLQMMGETRLQELRKDLKETARKNLSAVENQLKQAGFKTRSILRTGVPFREILNVEAEEGVSVIVIGSHGMSNLEEIFLGSVSEKVIRRSAKPVLGIKR